MVSFSICKSLAKPVFHSHESFPVLCPSVGAELLPKIFYKPNQDNYSSGHIYVYLKGANHLYKLHSALCLYYLYNRNLVFGCIYYQSKY